MAGDKARRTMSASRDSIDRRIALLQDSVVSKHHDANAQIERALKDRSPRVRATAIELVARKREYELLDSIGKMLADSSDLVRVEAAQAISELEQESGGYHPELMSLLRDAKWTVRLAAIESLVLLRDTTSIPEIAELLEDKHALVRANAAIGLAELGCISCLNLIIGSLSREADDAASAGLLVAIMILGDGSKFSEILMLLHSRRYQVRCFVANWLTRLQLDDTQLKMARAAVRGALQEALGRADESTLSRVIRQLRINGQDQLK